MLIISPEYEGMLRPLVAELGIPAFGTEELQTPKRTTLADIGPERRAMILYTSGTTSKPKQYRAKKPHIDIVRKAQDTLEYKLYTSVDLDDEG